MKCPLNDYGPEIQFRDFSNSLRDRASIELKIWWNFDVFWGMRWAHSHLCKLHIYIHTYTYLPTYLTTYLQSCTTLPGNNYSL